MGDIYTVAQAAQKYFMVNGVWPGEGESTPCENLHSGPELNGVYYSNINANLNPLNLDPQFECPESSDTSEHPLLFIRWEMPNEGIGELLNVNIPMSELRSENYSQDGNIYTAYYLEVAVPAPSVSPRATSQVIKHVRIDSGDELISECRGGLTEEILAYAPTAYCNNGSINGYRILQRDADDDGNIRYKIEVKPTLGGWVSSNNSCGSIDAEIDIIYRCVKP